MLHDKAECGIELLGVKQRDKDTVEKADVANMSSTMDEITVSLEHATLELTGKAVKEEKDEE
jgi:hypothetical protein